MRSASRAGSFHRRSQAAGEVGLSEPPTSDALPASAPASLVDAPRQRALARSRMAPSVRRRRSSPQPQEGTDALAPPPNDLAPNNRLDDMPLTNCGDIGARGRQRLVLSTSRKTVGPRSSYLDTNEAPRCKQSEGVLFDLHPPHFSLATEAKSLRGPRSRALLRRALRQSSVPCFNSGLQSGQPVSDPTIGVLRKEGAASHS